MILRRRGVFYLHFVALFSILEWKRIYTQIMRIGRLKKASGQVPPEFCALRMQSSSVCFVLAMSLGFTSIVMVES